MTTEQRAKVLAIQERWGRIPHGNVLYVVRFDIGGRTCRMRADELIAR